MVWFLCWVVIIWVFFSVVKCCDNVDCVNGIVLFNLFMFILLFCSEYKIIKWFLFVNIFSICFVCFILLVIVVKLMFIIILFYIFKILLKYRLIY